MLVTWARSVMGQNETGRAAMQGTSRLVAVKLLLGDPEYVPLNVRTMKGEIILDVSVYARFTPL